MKDKHTPGPWTIDAHNDLISDKDGNILAHLRCTKTTSVGNGWLPMEANARLIAAAPELLYMVQQLSDRLPRTYDDDQRLYLQAKELIAKIEGDE